MAMKKIPTGEQSLLCASVYINNFKRVIEELVYNSLDADSSSIAIRVCIQECCIQVLDNGNGISKDNFTLLGKKYTTSKYIDITTLKSAPNKYGFRGLSLATIIDVSQSIKICSRHKNSNDTWLKIFYNGKEKEASKTIARPSKGTTVEIKGFLYNLNIQRKAIEPHNELQNIKSALQQLSLVHCNVSLSLRDDSKNDIIFQIHKNRNIYKTLWSLFQINEKDFQELQIEKNEYKVKAFIGKNTVKSNNRYQWIYLNGKFISKSVLHKNFNEMMSKFLIIRNNNKSTNKHIYEDENTYSSCNIPFYFVFVSCPNYDFDITYNSEKVLVEFKDWKEIYKLIVKLVQFYFGQVSSESKKKEIKKVESKQNNTRTKIKEIMEKILNNKNKQSKISQMQNGIKGKILKRKPKKSKDTLKKSLNKYTENNSCQLREISKFSTGEKIKNKSVPKQHSINLERLNNNQLVHNDAQNRIVVTRTPKIEMNKKTLRTKDNFYFNKSLVKKFETQSKIVKKRCKYLNRKVKKLLDKNIFNDTVPYNINIKTCSKYEYYNIKNTETVSVHKQVNEDGILELMNILSSIYVSESKNKENHTNHQIVKQSYDLLKTVVTTHSVDQIHCQNKNNLINECSQYYRRKSIYTDNEVSIPRATYNSHNYTIEAAKRVKISHIICENSCNNFFLREQKLLPNVNKNIFRKTKLPLNKLIHKNYKQILSNNCNDKLQEFSCNIAMTDSHEIIYYQSDSFITKTNPTNNFKMNLNLTQVLNHTKSIYFGNTYTLEDDILSSRNDKLNKLQQTLSLQTFNISSSCHFEDIPQSTVKEIVDNGINDGQIRKKDFIIISESESNNRETPASGVDPLKCCEAVLNHSNELRDFENEFENSLFYRKEKFSYSKSNYVKKQNHSIDDNLQINDISKHNNTKSANSFGTNLNVNTSLSNNRMNNINSFTKQIENETFNAMQNIEINNVTQKTPLQIDNIKFDNDRAYNFQLRSRHRFMPKGMSPITKNIYPQTGFSLKNDDIYYKDMIYEKFANDVLLNSEIFEPEVHNVRNSKAIEKVKEVQKENADLIFNTQSLKGAKILGQVDRKFIATILNCKSSQTGNFSDFLVLFDQHAVDERIRLETNLSEYIQGSRWKSVDIDPVTLVLSKDDYVYVLNHKDKLNQFGLQWTFISDNEILLNAIPKAILGQHPRQVEIVMKAIKKLISEQIKAIVLLKGNVSLYPKTIMELVFNEACRYAVKFGDKLSKSDCTTMIDSLADCKTPFQCAHGRPVMAVIMELSNNCRSYKINLTKTKRFITKDGDRWTYGTHLR